MALFLLDTNTVSRLVRGGDLAVRERFQAARPWQCRISVITEAEIRFGLALRGNPDGLASAVGRFLASIKILPWTSREAEVYADLLATMRSRGKSLAIMDLLIATQAVVANAVLVTNDGAFKQIDGLRVVDWTA